MGKTQSTRAILSEPHTLSGNTLSSFVHRGNLYISELSDLRNRITYLEFNKLVPFLHEDDNEEMLNINMKSFLMNIKEEPETHLGNAKNFNRRND